MTTTPGEDQDLAGLGGRAVCARGSGERTGTEAAEGGAVAEGRHQPAKGPGRETGSGGRARAAGGTGGTGILTGRRARALLGVGELIATTLAGGGDDRGDGAAGAESRGRLPRMEGATGDLTDTGEGDDELEEEEEEDVVEEDAEEDEGGRSLPEDDLSDETNEDIVSSEESESSANASITSSSHESPTSSVSPKPRLKRQDPSGDTITDFFGLKGWPPIDIAIFPVA